MVKTILQITEDKRLRYATAGLLTAREYTQDKEYVADDELPDVWHGKSESVRYQVDAIIDTLNNLWREWGKGHAR